MKRSPLVRGEWIEMAIVRSELPDITVSPRERGVD